MGRRAPVSEATRRRGEQAAIEAAVLHRQMLDALDSVHRLASRRNRLWLRAYEAGMTWEGLRRSAGGRSTPLALRTLQKGLSDARTERNGSTA
jgi:hypothetical protein